MGEWKKIKLKDILVEGSKERVIDTSKYQKLTIKLNLKGMEKSKVREKMADRRPFYIRNEGEIVIGKQNYFNGSIAILPKELDGGICSNAIMSFNTKEGYSNKYIYYVLSDTNFINKRSFLANGTGQKELSEKDFLNFEVMVPSIKEQEKIVEILEKVDLIIKKYENLLEEKNRFIKSQFAEIFENKDYSLEKIENIAENIFAGGDKPKDISTEQNEIYKYPVFANGCENGGLQGYSKEYKVDKVALTISARGTIGYTFVREKQFTPIVRLITIIPNERINLLYLKYAIDNIKISSSGTSQAQLTVPALKTEKIILPPIEIQNKFGQIVKLINKQKFELEKLIENYKNLKKGLMQQLLTGKRKVKI